ncbi:MAG: PDZ domain-containing protein [Epsilonproteobacteria bacterium]|nr:PDZ domain-containing protein [Campylobacterota bacterium]
MSIDSKKSYATLLALVSGLVLAKGAWVYVQSRYLPKVGVEKEDNKKIRPLYYRYNLASKKEKPKIVQKKTPIKRAKPKPKPRPKPQEIKKFILKGIIATSRGGGIVTLEYKGKTYVLKRGEELAGYKLVRVNPFDAIFTKDNEKYKLELFNQKNQKPTSTRRNFVQREQKPLTTQPKKDIIQEGDMTIISKNLFEKYKSNIREVTRSINVTPVRSGKKLKGFKIVYIKKGSDFDKLGVKVGDIITAINGEEITDFRVPIEFFNNLDTTTAATITIKRGNEVKELEYEVR